MKAITHFDYPGIPAGGTTNVRLMLSLFGNGAQTKTPLNIALVVDRSGSMQEGYKLAEVKEAAKMMVGMLNPYDVFSLVAFNEKVETIVPVAKGADLAGVNELIDRLVASGDTNLSGGYKEGLCRATEAGRIGTSRIVLLSDGKANRGIKSTNVLSKWAEDFRLAGVSTTTFGVGNDFNENLLNAMAEQGGGNSYFIADPWQAADVFREELEELRSIDTTRVTVRFFPSSGIKSCTQINNFPEKSQNEWFIGDISSTRECRLVLELEVEAGKSIGEMCIGTFELYYSLPGREQVINIKHQAFLSVVTDKEFEKYKPDREVTLEAALLMIGGAKREARGFALAHNYVAASCVLDDCYLILSGLGLYDPELELELDRLKERAWQLLNRGKDYFNPEEQKYLAYEAELGMKGKRDKYQSMMARKDRPNYQSVAGAVIGSFLTGALYELRVKNYPDRTVKDFLAEIYEKVQDAVDPGSYGKSWLLRDKVSGRTFDVGTPWARSQSKPPADRTLADLGMSEEIVCLEVLPLPRMFKKNSSEIAPNRVRFELDLLGDQVPHDLPYQESMIACDFLAQVYQLIRHKVPPNSYGRQWVVRDATTGRVFDFGSAWARFHNMQADVRPIEKVGIRGGSLLQAFILKY